MGKHKEARIKLEETIKKLDELRGEGLGQTPIPCDLMINLGRTYHKDGDMKSAIEIYQQAEKMQNRLTSSRDRSVLTLNLYMAESFAESDQRANAVEYIKRAVELGHKLYGNRNLSIKLAEIYAFAGHVYGRCSLDDEALSLLNRSLELLQILLGDKPHPVKVNALMRLGFLFYQKHQMSKAVESLENGLRQAKIVYHGKNRLPIADTLAHLGAALKSDGKFKESLAYFQDAKEVTDDIFGPEYVHPNTSAILSNLATVCQELGDLKQAKEYGTKSVDVDRKLSKTIDGCPSVAFRLHTLSEICHALGEQDEAVKCLEEARAILQAASSKHALLVMILSELMIRYYLMGSMDKLVTTAESFPENYNDRLMEILEMLTNDDGSLMHRFANYKNFQQLPALIQGKC